MAGADLDKLDPQAVLDGVDDVSTGDPTFDDIGAEAARQLFERLTAGEKLPGTDLMKIVASYFKAKEEALKAQPDAEVVFTLPQLLADVNLPAERKHELLTVERDHHQGLLAQIEEALCLSLPSDGSDTSLTGSEPAKQRKGSPKSSV